MIVNLHGQVARRYCQRLREIPTFDHENSPPWDDLQIDVGDDSDGYSQIYDDLGRQLGSLAGITGQAGYFGTGQGGQVAVLFGKDYVDIQQSGNEEVSEDALIQLTITNRTPRVS